MLCFASIGKIELLSDSGEVKPMALLFEFALLSNGSKVEMQLKGIKGKEAEPEGAPVLYGWHWWRRIEKEFHRSYTKLEHAVHKVMEHVNINCSVSLDKGGSSNCNVQPH